MIWRKIILSFHLSLNLAVQLSLESNYLGFSKAISPRRSLSNNRKEGPQKTRVDGESIMGDNRLRGPQRRLLIATVWMSARRYLTILSLSQPARERWISRCTLVLREKAAGETPSCSVKFQSPAGRQCVLVIL